MLYYLIACRSLTYAQRVAAMLRQAGITAQLVRTPAGIPGNGCGYSVKLSPHRLARAMELLRKNFLPFSGLYAADDSSPEYREVPL